MIKNLITNKDLKDNRKLVFLIGNLKRETDIQSYARILFYKHQYYKNWTGEFVQVDNGGKSSMQAKIRKKREGTQAGFPDIMILACNKERTKRYTCFVEFKKIGTPSQIEPKQNQKEWNAKLDKMGYDSHYCNNLLYFQEIILKKIDNYLK